MLDRKYFEDVLPAQVRHMERPVRLGIHVSTGEAHLVHALVTAYDGYAVFEIYGKKKKPPKHGKPWREANPDRDAAIFDQVSIPYASIVAVHLTARTTEGDDARTLIGLPQA